MNRSDRAIECILRGASLSEALQISEATITPETINDFVKSPAYKNLERNAMKMLQDLESNEEYKRGRFTEDPIGSLEDEIENCEYVASIIDGINIDAYGPDVKSKVAKIINPLRKGARTLKNKLAKLSKSDFIGDDGQLKMKQKVDKEGNVEYTKGNPKKGIPSVPKTVRDYPYSENEYTARALDGLTNFFKLLGVPWDFDYKWNDYINNPGTKLRPVDLGVPESVQKDIDNVIISAKARNFVDKETLSEALELTSEEKDYFESSWRKIFGEK